MQLPLVMERCTICDMELDWRAGKAKNHITACEQIEMGLLAEQLTPEVEELPAGFVPLPDPLPDKPWGGPWRG